ncbi:FAD-dependent oxidoreductase [Viridibacillus sp. NPDC096237]|uniref:FAD-dependent oxidoreductase n=1 Tax=Viridibacillus sp. NPDC096237 TaxID=3390721 RepID=UPI003CFCA89E
MESSIWLDKQTPFARPSLEQSIETDICIIGGGISGILAAYLLSKVGRKVTLLEGNTLFSGATGHSTGKVTAQQGLLYSQLITKFGVEAAQQYYELSQQAVELSFNLAESDCVHHADSFLYTEKAEGRKDLENEWEAYQTLGIPGEWNADCEIPYDIVASLKMPKQAQIDPVRFGRSIAEKALQAGAEIYEQSRVQKVNILKPCVELKNGHTVCYKELILCSHYPLEAIIGMQIFKLEVTRSYIVTFEASELYKGQYLSIDKPGRSIRTTLIDDKPFILLAGDSHPAGTISNTSMYYEALKQEAKDKFAAQNCNYHWSAQDPETVDLIPYVGQISSRLPNIWMASGFRKWGLANSIVAAQLLRDGIVGKPNAGISLYSPKHTKFGDAVFQALKLGGKVTKDFVGGHVTRRAMPRCTHLGCKTRWNEADETWDCPCHGSRFSKDGAVLEGPAVYPLDLSGL